jgi:hypothetical protein
VIFCRKGVCRVCGCRVEIQRYESLAKVLKRIDEMTGCPNCGCAMAWQDTYVAGRVEAPRKAS